jgi:hypothetical protein
MTEEQAQRSAEALALAMGITFYVVRTRDGDFSAVQLPPDDSEIIATVPPPTSVHDRGLGSHRDVEPPEGSRDPH